MTPDADKLFGQIESWLDAQLPAEEVAAFADRLEKEADLRERVEQHRLARVAIDAWVAEDYKNQAKAWREEMEQKEATLRRRRLWWGLGLMAIIACAIWFWVNKNEKRDAPSTQNPIETRSNKPKINSNDIENSIPESPEIIQESKPTVPQSGEKKEKTAPSSAKKPKTKLSNEKIIAITNENLSEYWAVVEERARGRSRSADNQTHFDRGNQAFASGNFAVAERELALLTTENGPDYTNALELRAIMAFTQAEYGKAAALYEQFAPRKIGPATDWYLLLFYTADYPAREKAQAQLMDKILRSTEHPYYRQAKALKMMINGE